MFVCWDLERSNKRHLQLSPPHTPGQLLERRKISSTQETPGGRRFCSAEPFLAPVAMTGCLCIHRENVCPLKLNVSGVNFSLGGTALSQATEGAASLFLIPGSLARPLCRVLHQCSTTVRKKYSFTWGMRDFLLCAQGVCDPTRPAMKTNGPRAVNLPQASEHRPPSSCPQSSTDIVFVVSWNHR